MQTEGDGEKMNAINNYINRDYNFDIHVMVSWQLSKQGIRWPVSHDHIVGSGVELIEIVCFLNLTADQVIV